MYPLTWTSLRSSSFPTALLPFSLPPFLSPSSHLPSPTSFPLLPRLPPPCLTWGPASSPARRAEVRPSDDRMLLQGETRREDEKERKRKEGNERGWKVKWLRKEKMKRWENEGSRMENDERICKEREDFESRRVKRTIREMGFEGRKSDENRWV